MASSENYRQHSCRSNKLCNVVCCIKDIVMQPHSVAFDFQEFQVSISTADYFSDLK